MLGFHSRKVKDPKAKHRGLHSDARKKREAAPWNHDNVSRKSRFVMSCEYSKTLVFISFKELQLIFQTH